MTGPGNQRLHNLLVSGGVAHDFEVTSQRLVHVLESVGIVSSVTTDIDDAFAALSADPKRWDLVTVNALRWRMDGVERYAAQRAEWGLSLSSAARRGVRDYIAAGQPLLAMHSACICFDDWPECGEIVGGAWNWSRSSHPPFGSAVPVTVHADRHPIVAGLQDFEIVDEVYGFLDTEPDVVPLLSSPHGAVDHPLLWARTLTDGARVVFDALGHDHQSYDHAVHRLILQRAGQWLTRQGHHRAPVQAGGAQQERSS